MQTMETCDQISIHILNEADEILGFRRPVSDQIEQVEYAFQNILLQEPDDFKGISIATTNQEENLDSTFNRRILQKVRFINLTDEMRNSIWKYKLPDFSEKLVKYLKECYELNGGQIDKVAKKVDVSRLLNPNTALHLNT
jgi:SpoVK/Ycf46/Vps4 family AAA+-type ATPase